MEIHRAYSLLEVKSADDDARVITGIASTPEPDRMSDIVEPKGAQFKLPLPLLWQHDKGNPIGWITQAKVSKGGIEVVGQIAKDVTAEIDRAWSLIKAGLVRGLSIGFRAIDAEPIDKNNPFGGLRFKEWEWLELSAVTIPANAAASITTIRSIDSAMRENDAEQLTVKPLFKTVWLDTNKSNPGASGKSKNPKPEVRKMSTLAEQITAYEVKRRSLVDKMDAITNKCAEEGRTKDEKERDEFDTAGNELESVNREIDDLQRMEKLKAFAAKPVNGGSQKDGTDSRAISVQVKSPDLPLGTRFARVAMAIAAGKGSLSDSLMYAKRWESQTPEIISAIKAVAGNTGDGSGVAASGDDWGAELVYPTNLLSEFLQLLMPRTIIGRLSGLRNVPFNVRILGQDSGATVNWVGEGAVKPVGELDFSFTTLLYHKIAGIVVITDELVRLSRPNAETMVRDDLVRQVQKFMDEQFVDPNVFATDNRPASITNGVSGTAASGTTADDLYFDLNAMLATFDDSAEASDANITLLMRWSTARGISMLRNALGQFEFASLGQAGGTLFGYPVITSKAVPSGNIIAVNGGDIAIADDGRTRLDASNQATIDMNGGASPTTSLWQRNLLGLRVERFVTWKKLRSSAVAMITSAAYGPQASS